MSRQTLILVQSDNVEEEIRVSAVAWRHPNIDDQKGHESLEDRFKLPLEVWNLEHASQVLPACERKDYSSNFQFEACIEGASLCR